MRSLIVILAMCLSAPSANAQLYSGTVGGRITVPDPRVDPYLEAGFPRSTDPSANGGATRLTNRFNRNTVVLSDVLVVVCVRLAYAPCTPLWTRTNGAGQYSVPWSGLAPPTSIRTRVYAQQPNIPRWAVVSSVLPPEATFRVTTAGVTDVIIGESTATTNLTGNRTINVVVNDDEPTAAFQTAREVYTVLGAQVTPPGGSITSDMVGVDIFANDIGAGAFGGGGVALTDDEVLLVPGTAINNPFSLAHELGHIVAWRSLDLGGPPYEFSAYEACGADGDFPWTDFSLECEKPAFWEGFAHVVAGVWMWIPTVQPTSSGDCGASGHGIPRGGCTSLESPTQHPSGPVISADSCGGFAPAHRRAICNARGLWDLVDRTNGADRDLGELVRVLRAYPRVCLPYPFDNRCVGEFGYDGMNWKDYRANHLVQFPDDVQTLNLAEGSNNLLGSVND